MRLIDADKLKNRIRCMGDSNSKPELYKRDDVIAVIDDSPTAYDVDKVVEQLQAEKYIVGVNATVNDETTADYIEGFNDMVKLSISIVKEGAVKDE